MLMVFVTLETLKERSEKELIVLGYMMIRKIYIFVRDFMVLRTVSLIEHLFLGGISCIRSGVFCCSFFLRSFLSLFLFLFPQFF